MKIDADRKDALIAEQRQQIAELQRYRDQYYSTKAQLQLAEEKLHLQEQEFVSRISETQEKLRDLEAIEGGLRRQLVTGERERVDETRALRAKVCVCVFCVSLCIRPSIYQSGCRYVRTSNDFFWHFRLWSWRVRLQRPVPRPSDWKQSNAPLRWKSRYVLVLYRS